MMITICADEEVLEAAIKMATTITRILPLAEQAIKQSILHGMDASLEAALFLERKLFNNYLAQKIRARECMPLLQSAGQIFGESRF